MIEKKISGLTNPETIVYEFSYSVNSEYEVTKHKVSDYFGAFQMNDCHGDYSRDATEEETIWMLENPERWNELYDFECGSGYYYVIGENNALDTVYELIMSHDLNEDEFKAMIHTILSGSVTTKQSNHTIFETQLEM